MRKIDKTVFEPEYAISKNLIELSRKELCELVAEICRQVKAESGTKTYHGGIYPENISRNPDGVIAIGPMKRSDWSAQEIAYIAPEIYWNNKPGPESDVYALGLLLYFGASAGKLPFEGSSNNAQLMRMSGKTVYAPAAAGRQLGDIIEKSLRFKAADRYSSVEELAVMLDYCEDNRLLNSKTPADAIFRKDEAELSDLEQIMLSIIEGGGEPVQPDEPAAPPEEKPAGEQTEDEMFSEAGLVRPPHVEREDYRDSLEEIFGLDEPDPRDPRELEEEEEIRVYEPGEKKGIPILTEEDDPELAPVKLTKKNTAVKVPPKQQKRVVEEEEEEQEERRRPILVVLLFLAVLLIAAVVAKILIDAFGDTGNRAPTDVSVVMPSSETGSDFDVSSILSEEQIQYLQEQEQLQQQQQQQQQEEATPTPEPTPDPATLPHRYEAIKADVSWEQAKEEALAKGGYLVTVNSEEELNTVTQLAEQAGFDRVWIGGHRVNGEMVWESGENVNFYRWGNGEPSYTDSGDGVAEDYILLWYFNGQWVYNDSRENPLKDYYGMYGGRIGYVVEYVG